MGEVRALRIYPMLFLQQEQQQQQQITTTTTTTNNNNNNNNSHHCLYLFMIHTVNDTYNHLGIGVIWTSRCKSVMSLTSAQVTAVVCISQNQLTQLT